MARYERLIEKLNKPELTSREKVSMILRELKYVDEFSDAQIEELFKLIKELDQDFGNQEFNQALDELINETEEKR